MQLKKKQLNPTNSVSHTVHEEGLFQFVKFDLHSENTNSNIYIFLSTVSTMFPFRLNATIPRIFSNAQAFCSDQHPGSRLLRVEDLALLRKAGLSAGVYRLDGRSQGQRRQWFNSEGQRIRPQQIPKEFLNLRGRILKDKAHLKEWYLNLHT